MAIQFVDPKVVSLTVDVGINSSGNIAMEGETATGQKTLTIGGFKASGTGTNAETVIEKIVGDIGGANYDTLSAKKKYVVTAEEAE